MGILAVGEAREELSGLCARWEWEDSHFLGDG